MVSAFTYCSAASPLRQECSKDLELTDCLGCLPGKIPGHSSLCLPSAGTRAFYVGTGDLNSDLMVAWQAFH